MLAASCGFSDGFGAAVTPGGCPAHPTSKSKSRPKEAVVRLQKALRALADRTHDSKVYAKPDGLVGKKTVAAVNYAIPKYAPNALQYVSGELTKSFIIEQAPQLAAVIEKAPFISAKVTSGIYRPPAPAIQTALAPVSATASPTGANMPPYYGPPPPSYYPPSYGPPRVGGLPADRASVDIKTFIPAQYEHVRFNPGTIALLLGVGVVVYAVATKGGGRKGRD